MSKKRVYGSYVDLTFNGEESPEKDYFNNLTKVYYDIFKKVRESMLFSKREEQILTYTICNNLRAILGEEFIDKTIGIVHAQNITKDKNKYYLAIFDIKPRFDKTYSQYYDEELQLPYIEIDEEDE